MVSQVFRASSRVRMAGVLGLFGVAGESEAGGGGGGGSGGPLIGWEWRLGLLKFRDSRRGVLVRSSGRAEAVVRGVARARRARERVSSLTIFTTEFGCGVGDRIVKSP